MKNIKPHIEWFAFLFGLILMATMNPYETGETFCLIERAGISFCPGNGLGHSIAFLFRGEFTEAMHANMLGPFAVIILSFRIINIWKVLFKNRILNRNNGEQNVEVN